MSYEVRDIVDISHKAGAAIMEVYAQSEITSVSKEDKSPLTEADLKSHLLILKELKRLTPDTEILSEESKKVPFEVRNKWKSFWLVDPLDGTKEFIKKRDEFTVNIALIQEAKPVLGVVYAPAKHWTFFATTGQGAYKIDADHPETPIRANPNPGRTMKVVVSRSHGGNEKKFLEKLGPYDSIQIGSSLKLCLVAEGKAHLYPRFWPSMEWDTAAAECVVTEAGALVSNLKGEPLIYNKENLKNPEFIVSAIPQTRWLPFLQEMV